MGRNFRNKCRTWTPQETLAHFRARMDGMAAQVLQLDAEIENHNRLHPECLIAKDRPGDRHWKEWIREYARGEWDYAIDERGRIVERRKG
jgi:hypothetical protein